MSEDEVRKYLASIGAKGGKKSKRKLTKREASRIAKERWRRVKAAQADAAGSSGSAKPRERANKKRSRAET